MATARQGTPATNTGVLLARTGVPLQPWVVYHPLPGLGYPPSGQVTLWAVRLVWFPEGGLSLFMNLLIIKQHSCQFLLFLCRGENRIDFHNINKFDEVILSHSVAPSAPVHLSPMTSSGLNILVYIDFSDDKREVKWLCCTTDVPFTIKRENDIHFEDQNIAAVTCVKDGTTQLIVTADPYGQISVFDAAAGGAAKTPEEMRGINAVAATTDSKGHLFIYDKNISSVIVFNTNCQRLFVINFEELGIGGLKCMRWCEKTVSLIIKHNFRLKKMGSDDDDDEYSDGDDDSGDDEDSTDGDDSMTSSSSDEFSTTDDDESDDSNDKDDDEINKKEYHGNGTENIQKDKKEIITVVKTFFPRKKMLHRVE